MDDDNWRVYKMGIIKLCLGSFVLGMAFLFFLKHGGRGASLVSSVNWDSRGGWRSGYGPGATPNL